ncbi:MAG: heparan-alpha-glucosaminide N-acetyltransferase domain-containing protein [Bryobacteraceae bacterium]
MASTRLVSLDVFRGLTMASMILVNNPGAMPEGYYAQLRHAKWHGWTFTDIIFPSFLWIVGVAMTFSFAKRVERGENRVHLLLHALRRAAIIFGLGLFLNGFPYFPLATIRIPGVLQRIAICYLIAALIVLYTGLRGRVIALFGVFITYTLLMQPGGFELPVNFAQRVDWAVLNGHMWGAAKFWDPEGIVSTLPAIGTTLFGILVGMLLRSAVSAAEKTAWMFFSGNCLIFLGLVCSVWQPINKSLWTVSYAILMAGISLVVFACCYWLVDVRGWKRWSKPFVVYGMNAIAIYVFSGVLARCMGIKLFGDVSTKQIVYNNFFLAIASPVNAALLYALANVAVMYVIAWVMYRRGWFVKF